jgi:hypothetical protein
VRCCSNGFLQSPQAEVTEETRVIIARKTADEPRAEILDPQDMAEETRIEALEGSTLLGIIKFIHRNILREMRSPDPLV